MLKDGGNQPGSLPLVQDTLTELWQKRVDNSLKLSVYVKLGGISGTLNKRATAFYNRLSDSEKETIKHIFLALTQLGEGTEDTRRRVLEQDLITVKYTEGVIDVMIQKLANERLIVTDKPGETTDKKMAIEVTHEALIREWELLRQWLDQDRANLLQQRKIEVLAQEWENSGRKSAYLLVGFRLKEARKFQKEQALQYPLKKLGSDFIAKSLGKQQQNFWKLGIIPLIGVGVITFFGIRTYIVQSSWKIVQETQGDKYDVRRINALEDLFWWQESLANISFQKANLSQIQLPNANLTSADLYSSALTRANLNSANLEGANINSSSLLSANLESANLRNADLSRASLLSANLESANLSRASLSRANLESANLSRASLSRANLEGANLKRANLSRANLEGANFIEAENLTNTQIKLACFWDKAIYKGHFKAIYKGHFDEPKIVNKDWITDVEAIHQAFIEQLKDEKANQAFIEQLKKDKSSDPKVKPDCSEWEK
jgi:hypothetical protein